MQYVRDNWGSLYQFHEGDLTLAQIHAATRNLEGTYTIRLFAEFEALLRAHLVEQGRAVPAQVRTVINRVATLRRIDDEVRDGAHCVREYRNALVHPIPLPVAQVTIHDGLSRLNHFVAPLTGFP